MARIPRPAGTLLTAGLLLALALPAGAQGRCADYVPGPKPQNAGRDIVGADLDAIEERGWIEFAVYDAYPPYSFAGQDGPEGIDVELGRLIAETLGVEARFRLVSSDETLEGDLRNWVWKGPVIGGKVANVMLRVPYDSDFACRVEQVVFTGQYAQEAIAIAYDAASYPEDKPVPAYFRYDSVGVENDSISDFYLSGFAGGQMRGNVHRYASVALALDALGRGEVMAVMGPRGQLEAGLPETADLHQPPLPGLAVGRWTLGVAVHQAYRALGYAVDDAILAALEDGRIAAIYAARGLQFMPPER